MNISGLSTVLRIACLCLTLMSVPVAAQIRNTASHSEDVAGGGRKETTETKFEDGTVSIETKYWDANGKLQSHANETKHPDGDTTIDANEWMTACNNGLVKSSSGSGASPGESGAAKPAPKPMPPTDRY